MKDIYYSPFYYEYVSYCEHVKMCLFEKFGNTFVIDGNSYGYKLKSVSFERNEITATISLRDAFTIYGDKEVTIKLEEL